ncbi:MAG: DeoR family transcriptional regulator [Chloroflexi bacterium]|nr:DeoR family transcriptional regulator [Chloroflexota bacterium]
MLRQGKGQEIDFLPERTSARRLAESLMALANASGGTVLVGVDPGLAKPRGLKDAEAARDEALEAAFLTEPPLIIPLPEVVTVDDKDVLVITVPPGLPHVYSLRGKYLIRVGAQNKPLALKMLRRLIIERGEVSFESLIPPGATLDDVDWDKAERYLASLEGLSAATAEEALHNRGCLVQPPLSPAPLPPQSWGERGEGGKRGGYRPTNAGILLFGIQPQRFVKSSEIIVARYPGREMSDAFVREDIRGTLPDQIRRAEAFLTSNMKRGVRLVSLEREEQVEYPTKAVREAIVNAVAHRDYSIRGDEIRIFMFSDRIEFYSPGRLPGHVTVDNIVEERFSRNEVIVQVLADMGFIEHLGYGIDRMIKLMRDYGLPAPRFQETAGGFRVTLYSPHSPQLWGGRGGEGLVSEEEIDMSRWSHLDLNERQEQALAYLLEKERITNREYQELCPDVSSETIRRDLADLVNKNVLLKIGRKRATYYIFK